MAKKTNDKQEVPFFERLSAHPRPVVVDFWAPWCAPCRAIDPILKSLGKEYQDRVDVWKVNADEQPDLLRQLRIYGIPTVIAFQAGQEVTRRTGAGSPAGFRDLFEAALTGSKPERTSLEPLERFTRLTLGLLLVALAYYFASGVWVYALAALGGVVMFSAVYDRCPIYQTIAPRILGLFNK